MCIRDSLPGTVLWSARLRRQEVVELRRAAAQRAGGNEALGQGPQVTRSLAAAAQAGPQISDHHGQVTATRDGGRLRPSSFVMGDAVEGLGQVAARVAKCWAVSYTHLTLPTILRV